MLIFPKLNHNPDESSVDPGQANGAQDPAHAPQHSCIPAHDYWCPQCGDGMAYFSKADSIYLFACQNAECQEKIYIPAHSFEIACVLADRIIAAMLRDRAEAAESCVRKLTADLHDLGVGRTA